MPKINVNKIVADMQKLYAKDKKVSSIICLADTIKSEYKPEDMVPYSAEHPLAQLSALPGVPFNKIIQVVGKADSGKSTMAYMLVAAAQKKGIQAIYWDSEDKFDANRLKMLGGDPKEILMVKTNEILKGAELIRKYTTAVKDQDPSSKILIIWDSIGGSQSRSHAERELDNEKHAQPGQDAKENGSVMKMLIGVINKYPDSIAVYMANHSYAKIGFMQKGEKATGGDKVEYHSSFIVFLKRIQTLTKIVKGTKVKTGIISRATVTKNHLSQGKTSVHQMDFVIDADGARVNNDSADLTDDDE